MEIETKDKNAWLGLREIYKLIGSTDGNTVVRLLLINNEMRTNELIEKSRIPVSKFHVLMKALVTCQVIDKKVHQDRSVTYKVSDFGKYVLELSEPILDKIRDNFKDKKSELLSMVQQ